MLPLQLLFFGPKLWGLDAFGWSVIFFLLLFFGTFYTRDYLRRSGIPDWPIRSARINQVSIATGPPREIPVPPTVVPVTQLIPYHCRANYVFLIEGTLYGGSFALLAKSREQAQGMADSLRDQTVLIKYNPRNPKESISEESELLGTKVFQHGWNPINPKIW